VEPGPQLYTKREEKFENMYGEKRDRSKRSKVE
jgi:hypothetical protein